jgi:uncharacterized phiE125 gp8 family phage protein
VTLTLITAPASEPITLDEAKVHLRVDDTASDTLIGVQLQAAREQVEEYTRRALMPQTWELRADRFTALPCVTPVLTERASTRSEIRLGRVPVTSVTSVKYIDADGVEQTLSSSAYAADLTAYPPILAPAYGESWPTARDERGAVRVRFVAGYADAASVPAALKAAILLILADLYANREAQIVGTIIAANPTLKALLAPYRLTEAV